MNKIKASKKDMKDNLYIIGIGYCNAQYLLKPFDAIAYSSRAEGWACDYYYIDEVLVSTGYSYIDNKRVKYTYDSLRALELKASAIYNDYESKLTYKQKDNKVKKMFIKFLNDSIKNYKKELK